MYALYVCLLCIPCPEVIINHGGRPFCAHAYHTLCALSQPFARARALPTFPVPRPCVPSPPPMCPSPQHLRLRRAAQPPLVSASEELPYWT